MYLEIRKAELVPDKFGNNIKISMIRLNKDDGTYVKFLKIDEKILQELLKIKIPYNG